jgi:hypothetical protein
MRRFPAQEDVIEKARRQFIRLTDYRHLHPAAQAVPANIRIKAAITTI